jgi:hypothetical protein
VDAAEDGATFREALQISALNFLITDKNASGRETPHWHPKRKGVRIRRKIES